MNFKSLFLACFLFLQCYAYQVQYMHIVQSMSNDACMQYYQITMYINVLEPSMQVVLPLRKEVEYGHLQRRDMQNVDIQVSPPEMLDKYVIREPPFDDTIHLAFVALHLREPCQGMFRLRMSFETKLGTTYLVHFVQLNDSIIEQLTVQHMFPSEWALNATSLRYHPNEHYDASMSDSHTVSFHIKYVPQNTHVGVMTRFPKQYQCKRMPSVVRESLKQLLFGMVGIAALWITGGCLMQIYSKYVASNRSHEQHFL